MTTLLTFLPPFAAACLVGVVGWAIGINPRLSVIETRHADLKELIGSQLAETNRRLTRIETALNGALRRHDDHHTG